MSVNYAYNYAELDPETGECIGVFSVSSPMTFEEGDPIVEIPVNDDEYFGKYYLNGNWYEDAEGAIPWTSSML